MDLRVYASVRVLSPGFEAKGVEGSGVQDSKQCMPRGSSCLETLAGYIHGWLSKLWSLFGSRL